MVDSSGKQMWPHSEPPVAPPIPMKNQNEIIKGLSSLLISGNPWLTRILWNLMLGLTMT
jgi:hypothetical protein